VLRWLNWNAQAKNAEFAIPAKDAGPPKKEEPPQKSEVCLHLEKRKVEEQLRKLRDDDPDHGVRDAAKSALEKLTTLQEKKP
jgi:hypothetical protein